ncbi:aminodeoxychorismate synthase component I [Gordonia soli]|uniref:Anthranilate synthase component I n=1 Tax=Gordonia soli NBRC 108243 TaxID=1223545 RepID=M0QMJ3_9ACTN|nr:aminodeoxychorismate synthase component I [Gordonia soli]GAC68637.1 anthranilate synthase component I [Gordonia soli NBRC 108243]
MTAPALDVLHALRAHTVAVGMDPPAALIGDWLDADAVIAPSISLRAGAGPPDHPERWWFGYLGFPVRADDADLPTVAGGLTDAILVLRSGNWEYRSVDGSPWPEWVRRAVEGAPTPSPADWSATWHEPDPAPHLVAIDECLDAIRDGEVYQACVCTAFTGQVDGDHVAFYADLVATTAPAKSALLQGEWGTVASFSPETFLRRTGNLVSSHPIKGTVAAHESPDKLSRSTKDVAENVMIVDLVRNDLGRVAMTGSVRVPDLLSVTPAPGVWHLVSSVSAVLDPATGTGELLRATFPPASVTGTPKLRAMQLLADWEASPRGVYCGAIGLAGPEHALDLNVAIRTVTITPDGRARLGVGGGITIDSDPWSEWQECLDKAASIVRTDTSHGRT